MDTAYSQAGRLHAVVCDSVPPSQTGTAATKVSLRLNDAQAVSRLCRCLEVIGAIDVSGQGITYHPDAAELAILQGFEEVVNAAATRPDGEGWFDQLRQAAGLAPSSIGV